MRSSIPGQPQRIYRRSVRIGCLTTFLAAICLTPAAADSADIAFSSHIDWHNAEIVVTGQAPLDGNYSGETARAARQILGHREEAFRNAVMSVPISSTDSVRDTLRERPDLVDELSEREPAGTASGVSPTRDMRLAELTIRYPLHETLSRAYRPHETARALPQAVTWVPSKAYTGLVIDARGRLPVHGTEEESRVQPVVLPRLYDSEIRLLLESGMVEPEYLRRWGAAAYTSDPDLEDFEERIGTDPLYVAADGVFGTRPANPIIPSQTANRLLTLDENRELLAEGRVVIVLDPEVLAPAQ